MDRCPKNEPTAKNSVCKESSSRFQEKLEKSVERWGGGGGGDRGLIRLEHALITADLLNQNPTKKVMLLYKKIVLIRCCKWISFQSAEYNHY